MSRIIAIMREDKRSGVKLVLLSGRRYGVVVPDKPRKELRSLHRAITIFLLEAGLTQKKE